jgi:hypothetical protein
MLTRIPEIANENRNQSSTTIATAIAMQACEFAATTRKTCHHTTMTAQEKRVETIREAQIVTGAAAISC